MTTPFTLAPTMNATTASILPSTKTAFRFFADTITAQLKTLRTQRTKKVTGQQIKLLLTYLWRNGKVKKIDVIKDIIDTNKLTPLTRQDIAKIKKKFCDLSRMRWLNPQLQQHKHSNQAQVSNVVSSNHSKSSSNDYVLNMIDMLRLNIKVGQYIKLIDATNIVVGSRVNAPYKNYKRLYKGTVVSIDQKDTFCHVEFDDGDVDPRVPIKRVRLLSNESCLVEVASVNLQRIACRTLSGHSIILLNDGTLMSKISSFRICFEDDNKSMIDMSPELCNVIRMSWLNSSRTLDYVIESNDYMLDWSSTHHSQNIVGRGIQTNKKTQKKRCVYLLKWKPSKDMFHEFKRVSLQELPVEYSNVVRTLLKSYPQKAKTMKIYHLEPQLHGDKLLDMTCKIQELKKLSSETKVLVHGCSEKAIENIVVKKTGFQDAGTLNGKVYGSGIYLSSDPVYSARDYCPKGKRGTKMMLLCKTLIGGKKETTRTFKMFGNEKFRTGGSLAQGYEHIYMKPFVYATCDINIAYLVEF